MFGNPYVISLFGYEVYGEKEPLWREPMLFSRASGEGAKLLDEDFKAWEATKGEFTGADIVGTSWVKIGTHGYSFVVKFIAGGKFTERHVFSREDEPSWEGRWEIIEGVLHTTLREYDLYIVANASGSVHSGIEYMNHQPSVYFRLFLLR